MTKSFTYSILMRAEMSLFLDCTKIFKTRGVPAADILLSLSRGIKSNILIFGRT